VAIRVRFGSLAASVGLACLAVSPLKAQSAPSDITANLKRHLGVIAHDSMGGRRAASRGALLTAAYLAHELERFGITPAGEDGFFQPVPFVRITTVRGERLTLPSLVPEDSVRADRMTEGRNVIGLLRGSDPELRDEVVVVGAHFDHVGTGQPFRGDSIYNGADDDASGTVAVLELARMLAAGPAPKRTIVFLLVTAEEMGILGARYFVEHATVALDRVVANLQIEMIGRPDEAVGGAGTVWLTGDERSTMGAMFRAARLPVVPDPRPQQRFFQRSDNIAFARAGIPAHTLSSFGLHEDYHRPSDEIETIDWTHMAQATEIALAAVRVLADGARPQWNEGGRP
jgi:hypothetical protein